jgi:tRNA U34 5-methylaminomethyl-2-thiouridine-forming methyltransferase MnmC
MPEIRYNCYDRSYVVKEDVLSEILPQSKLALNLLEFLDEETLNRFLSSIEKTCMNFSEVVTAIVENKICSEGFILNYQKYLSEKSILRQHQGLIFTGEYSTLSLFLKLR